ncbi:hypothetical protein HPB52_014540 [Rhipicephalus sanguineus]|uniref:Uncharacterized protein n=1 Tax=Rhipicephalus sanguineus TaxID=34632 RepID=A0A9D4TAI4_RHISA|nr:hypothetical protein HPB52_014540 [Rhipicephalus sanguineus]
MHDALIVQTWGGTSIKTVLYAESKMIAAVSRKAGNYKYSSFCLAAGSSAGLCRLPQGEQAKIVWRGSEHLDLQCGSRRQVLSTICSPGEAGLGGVLLRITRMRGREGNLPALGSVQSKLERTQLQGSLNLAPKLVPPHLPLPAPSVGFASRVDPPLFFFVFGLGSFSWPDLNRRRARLSAHKGRASRRRRCAGVTEDVSQLRRRPGPRHSRGRFQDTWGGRTERGRHPEQLAVSKPVSLSVVVWPGVQLSPRLPLQTRRAVPPSASCPPARSRRSQGRVNAADLVPRKARRPGGTGVRHSRSPHTYAGPASAPWDDGRDDNGTAEIWVTPMRRAATVTPDWAYDATVPPPAHAASLRRHE